MGEDVGAGWTSLIIDQGQDCEGSKPYPDFLRSGSSNLVCVWQGRGGDVHEFHWSSCTDLDRRHL